MTYTVGTDLANEINNLRHEAAGIAIDLKASESIDRELVIKLADLTHKTFDALSGLQNRTNALANEVAELKQKLALIPKK